MNILIIVPYPVGKAASQRVRVEQFLPYLASQGIRYKIAPFWDDASWSVLYKPGHFLQKAIGVVKGFLQRLMLLPQLPDYDYILVHREATPLGPPWVEWCATKVLRKKIIFDFDDAIWLENTSAENRPAAKYKLHSKTANICSWSYRVSAGNSFLQNYARQYNTDVLYLPSTLNLTEKYHQLKEQHTGRVAIGWIGSHSTLPYLKQLEPVLQQLEHKYDFDFVVIADKMPDLDLRCLQFIPWQAETEVNDLLKLNIGVMPLPDTLWSKGKCAYKALQYMALGIPAVVSAVGANTEAVPDGASGYTCATRQDWYNSLEKLLLNADLRSEMGKDGRAWVAEKYAAEVHLHNFLQLFT